MKGVGSDKGKSKKRQVVFVGLEEEFVFLSVGERVLVRVQLQETIVYSGLCKRSLRQRVEGARLQKRLVVGQSATRPTSSLKLARDHNRRHWLIALLHFLGRSPAFCWIW